MRFVAFSPAARLHFYSGTPPAQGWIEYVNLDDYFTVNFPGEPEIEQFTYTSQYFSDFPARRYAVEHGPSTYEVTVIDMLNSSRPPRRRGNEWRGAVAYAAAALRQTGEVTYDAYGEINLVPGHQLQITLPDGRRSFVQIHFHKHRLYITEAIVPGNQPPPALFQASFAVTDEEGNRLRYLERDHSFPDDHPLSRRGDQRVTPNEADIDDVIAIGEAQN